MNPNSSISYNRKRDKGFTLIEVLVSLAIFAIMAAAGWKVFDTLNRVKTQNEAHALELSTLQSAYSQLLRDFSQTIPRSARQRGQTQPAFLLEQNKLTFTRISSFDPIQQGSTGLERVTYEYQQSQQRLVRYSYLNPDQAQTQTPPVTVLLNHVTNFNIKALDPAPSDFWPPDQLSQSPNNLNGISGRGDDRLPLGLEFNFSLNDTPFIWRYSLIKKLPISYIPSSSGADGKPSPDSNGKNNTGSNNTAGSSNKEVGEN